MLWYLLISVIGMVLGNLLVGPLVARGEHWRADRVQRANSVDCSLRVIEGATPGLTPRWRGGTAELTFGQLRFRPSARWRRPVAVGVAEVSRRNQRRAIGPEAILVPSTARVIQVETEGATLEWAVRGDRLMWALDRLRQES